MSGMPVTDRFEMVALEPSAVVASILSVDGLKAFVVQAYDLIPVAGHLIRHGTNDTYMLVTRDERYVARMGRVRRTDAEVGYELDLLNHLAEQGVPVSSPVATRDGRLSVPLRVPEGVRHLVLFQHAPGTPLSWRNPEHSYLAGRLLASLHVASDDFLSCHTGTSLDFSAFVDKPMAAIRPYLLHRPADLAFLDAFTNALRARVLAATKMRFDWGVCHGDFDVVNIHRGADQTLRVFDFDFCGPGWRALDFIPVLKAARSERAGTWDAFLRGYRETRPLTAHDLAAVPLLPAIGHFGTLGMLAANANVWGLRHLTDERIDQWLTFLRDWNAEHALVNF